MLSIIGKIYLLMYFFENFFLVKILKSLLIELTIIFFIIIMCQFTILRLSVYRKFINL